MPEVTRGLPLSRDLLLEVDHLIEEESSPAVFSNGARLDQMCTRLGQRQEWDKPQANLGGEMADAQRIGAGQGRGQAMDGEGCLAALPGDEGQVGRQAGEAFRDG